MAINYANMQRLAQKLIKESGRKITLVDESENHDDITVDAVMVLPNQVRIFGLSALGESGEIEKDLTENAELVYIAYLGDGQDKNPRNFNILKDPVYRSKPFPIYGTQDLFPGDRRILSYIGVRDRQ